MRLVTKLLLCLTVTLCSFCTGENYWEDGDEDTIIVQAAATEETENENTNLLNRVKRQSNSIFDGIPGGSLLGGGGNRIPGGGGGGFNFGNFPGFPQLPGFGGFQLPGFGGGINNQHKQIPTMKPTTTPKPVKPPQSSSCYTKTGEEGECAQFRQCYPLLFGSVESELYNPGLAYSLRTTAGVCSSEISNEIYNYVEARQSQKKICCAKPGSHVPGSKYPKLTTPNPAMQSTKKPPYHQQTTQMTTTTMSPQQPWPGAWQQPHLTQRTTTTTPRPSWPGAWQQQQLVTHAPADGQQRNCPGFYIIGGQPVQGRIYPWIASVKDGLSNRHVCGGSLVSGRSVLTAAHCVKQLGPQQVAKMRVYLGVNDITGGYNPGCSVVRKVKSIRYHRGFSMATLHDDIALLTLDSAVPVGGNIQTVSLASHRVGDVGTATVAGWGGVYLGGQPVGQLRHVTLDVVNNRVCAQRYVGSAPGGVTNNMMCAGSAGRDACLGDSGGPLHINNQQVGIVSFGTGCGTLPGVYTRVASYLPWIQKNMAN